MEIMINYWAQVTVLIGAIGYILKSIFDYRFKNKELKYKYFYQIKANKILELYTKIVELQMIIDRHKKDDVNSFESNVFRKRIALDQYYWESFFYFSDKTQKLFHTYLEWLKYFESTELMNDHPEIKFQFKKISQALIDEFKNEIKS